MRKATEELVRVRVHLQVVIEEDQLHAHEHRRTEQRPVEMMRSAEVKRPANHLAHNGEYIVGNLRLQEHLAQLHGLGAPHRTHVALSV